MTIVHTTVWVDYLRGTATPQAAWLERELSQQRLGITDLILCEVLQGIEEERSFNAVRRELLKLEVFRTGGIGFAVAAARNYRRLRASGRTVRRTMDSLIATFCLQNGHSLLHDDRDFDGFEEVLRLVVIHPSA